MDKTTEMKAGIINSAGMILPEIRPTFFEVKMNGLNFAIGSIIPNKDIRATIPPVKSMLVNICLNITHPINQNTQNTESLCPEQKCGESDV